MEEEKIILEKKILYIGPQSRYDSLETYDDEILYFCSDTRNVYRGSVLYTDGIRKVSSRPSVPATGILYYITSTDTLEFYDGTEWTKITVSMIPVNDISKSSTNKEVPSAKAVYDFIN